MTQSALLDQLEIDIRDLLEIVRAELGRADNQVLTQRPAPDAWNALECFAHLNAVCNLYFPKIEKAIHKAKARQWRPGDEVKYNWTGQRAVRAVDPSNLSRKKHRSPKRFDFQFQPVPPTALKAFLINYEMLLRFVQQCRDVDLNRPRIPTGRFSLFSFRLGNLLEYYVLHAKLHVAQALHAAATLSAKVSG
ncbi:MAG: DinB family protein [Saprospiraceae bacterium]